MPMNTRDLWLVLKAQDQTNRALNTFSRNVKNAGNTVRMAQLQAERASAMAEMQQRKLNNEALRAEVAQMTAQKAVLRHAAAQAQLQGASAATVGSLKNQSDALDREIVVRKSAIAQNQAHIATMGRHKAAIDEQIRITNAYNKSVQESEKNLSHLGSRMQSVSQTSTAMGFSLAAAGAVGFIALGNMIKTAMDYEKQVRATATQVDGFKGNLDELADIGRRVAREIAVPFEQIQPALFDIFSSMEVGVADAEKLLKSFSKAAVAGGVDIQDVSRATIGLLNAFQRPASDVNKILDVQFQLIQEGVGTYEEWNQRIGLVTPSAVRAGQSIELMMAALATATRMGMSAARSGTSVARAFDALSHPTTVKNLKNLGVNVQDAQGKFRPFNDVLRDFRTTLMKMPEKDRLAAILDVFKGAGGTIEARRFLQNVLLGQGQLELFDSILKETSNSAGSMEKAYALMADTAAAKSQLLRNQWDLLKEGLGRALIPAFTILVTWLTVLMDKFNALDPATKRNIALLLAAGSAFAVVAGAVLLLVGVIAAFAAAFTVAGSAILVTVGVLGGLVVALGGIAAAFVLAYKNSFEFGVMMGQIHQYFKLLYEIALQVGRGLRDAFSANIGPALEKLGAIIESKILPAFTMFMNLVAGEAIGKLREAGRIIVDVFGKAFEFIGAVIRDQVVPALTWLAQKWQENKQYIEPLIPIFAQVVKWVAIIAAILGGVLVAVIVGPVIAAFVALGAAIGLVIFIVAKIVQGAQWLWGILQEFGAWISGVFVAAWNIVASAISGAWSWIVNAFNTGVAWIRGLWEGFWNSTFGQLVMSVVLLVLSFIKLLWTEAQYLFAIGSAFIKALWNTLWADIKNYVVPILSWIGGFISNIWNGIKGATTTAWNLISNFLTSTWNTIKASVIAVFVTIMNGVRGPLDGIIGFISGWRDRIIGFFSGAAGWLLNAGREIVNGLISGITSRIDAARKKIEELTAMIKDHLPGSPVKTGPLRVLNNGYAGGQIVNMIAEGIKARQRMLANTMNLSASGMVDAAYGGGQAGMYLRESQAGGGKQVTQTINVYTQEIDPRKNSAELGWQLQGLM